MIRAIAWGILPAVLSPVVFLGALGALVYAAINIGISITTILIEYLSEAP